MQTFNISDEDGATIVRAARRIVTEFVKSRRTIDLDESTRVRLSFESGVFVTLNIAGDLRGCIGYPLPRNFAKALPQAAIAAATEDPRFSPVKSDELDRITFEVTILTPPSELKSDDHSKLPSMIKVGRDGLIIKRGYHSGLLLPQVPVELGWTETEFLGQTCHKAGLPTDSWLDDHTRVFSFEGIIFKEESPNGKVVRHTL